MNDRAVHSMVVRWLAKVSALQVIKADESGDRLDGAYIMVRLTGTDDVRDFPEGVSYQEAGDGTVMASSAREVEWRFSVHSYGSDASDPLQLIRRAADLGRQMDFDVEGFMIHDVSQVRNIPEFVEQKWEPRAQMDLIVRGRATSAFPIDTIEEFSFEFERS